MDILPDNPHEGSSSASTISSTANATALRPTSSGSNEHFDEAIQRLNLLMDRTADGLREICNSYVTQMKDNMSEAHRRGMVQLREETARVVEERNGAVKSVEELNERLTKMEDDLRKTKTDLERTQEEGRSMKLQLDMLMKEREERSQVSLRTTVIRAEEKSTVTAATPRTYNFSASRSSEHVAAQSPPSTQTRPARALLRKPTAPSQPRQSESSSYRASGNTQSTSRNSTIPSSYEQYLNLNLSKKDVKHGFSIAWRILEFEREAVNATPEMRADYELFLGSLSEHDRCCASSVLAEALLTRRRMDNSTISQRQPGQSSKPSKPAVDSLNNAPKRKRVNEEKDSQPVRSLPRPQLHSTNVNIGSPRKRTKTESR